MATVGCHILLLECFAPLRPVSDEATSIALRDGSFHLQHGLWSIGCSAECGWFGSRALISHDPTASRYDSRADRAEER